MINKERLGLYYSVGKYVSENSRNVKWGTSAIKQRSEDLQNILPGLRGFSEGAIKKCGFFTNRSLTMNDLTQIKFYPHSKIACMIVTGDFEQ